MKEGTSQGLFVIIAVVVFGIFVAISYLIFQDSLRPKLTTIFTESFSPSSLHTNEWIMSNSLESRMSKVLFKEGVYEIIYDSNIEVNNLGDKSPAGLRPVLNDINNQILQVYVYRYH